MKIVEVKKENVEIYKISDLLQSEYLKLWINHDSNYLYETLVRNNIWIKEFISYIYSNLLLETINFINEDKKSIEYIDITQLNDDDYNALIKYYYKKETKDASILLMFIKYFSLISWNYENDILTIDRTEMSNNIKYFFIKTDKDEFLFSDNLDIYWWAFWSAPFFMVSVNKIKFI